MAGTNLYSPTTNANVFVDMTNESGFCDSCELRGTTTLPTDTGLFSKGCLIKIENNGEAYINTAADGLAPNWVALGAGSAGITELTGNVTAGPGSGAQAATLAVADLESVTLTNITTTEILIGTGAGTAAYAALSGDATMSNAGVVTVVGATGAFEAGGAITNAGGTLAVGFIPTAVTSPQALTAPGAANITTYQTQYTSTGTGDVVTLIDATRIGHLKKISYVAEGAGGDTCVVTPTNLEGFTTATLAAIGDYVLLMWNGANWLVIEAVGATLA